MMMPTTLPIELIGTSPSTDHIWSGNVIVRGENRAVLEALLPYYQGKVQTIYIDPPYNTGNVHFQYHDRRSRQEWLDMMQERLTLAWEYLAPSGALFIQVDDSEQAYLKVLCDEIFGEAHFRDHIILKSSTESGVNAINVKRGERLFKVKEHILFYSKSTSFKFKPFYTKAAFNKNYRWERVHDELRDIRSYLSKQHFGETDTRKISAVQRKLLTILVEEYALSHAETVYSLERNIKKAGQKFKDFAQANKGKNLIETYIKSNGQTILVYDGAMLVPLLERTVLDNNKRYYGVLASDLWTDIPTTAYSEGDVSFRNGKKPEKLLQRMIEMTSNEGDLVLDFFLGSGTSAAVAHKMNRRYLGIEKQDYHENDARIRIQNVIDGDATGISKNIGWSGGGHCTFIDMSNYEQL